MLLKSDKIPAVSIVIRTKNEERWIGRCLKMLEVQSRQDFEVILVDNASTDATIPTAARLGVTHILHIQDYYPGQALNAGIKQAQGKYIVCLSAHCLPYNAQWLNNLLAGFNNPEIAGVYGRQIPVAFSSASDKRDLLITFGRDRREQIKDYFFHNANSAIRKDVWQKIPFNEQTTNIEDRLWAKAVLAQGFKILYEPAATVYHHHGIHQNNEPERAKNVVSIIEQVEDSDEANSLPAVLKPEATTVAAVVPVVGPIKHVAHHNLLADLITELQAATHVTSIYLLGDNLEVKQLAHEKGVAWLRRPPALQTKDTTVENVIPNALGQIERRGQYPDSILYVNYLYPFRPKNIFDLLIYDLQYQGLETMFPAYTDFNNYWIKEKSGDLHQVGDGLKSRDSKEPLYRALYGLGCVSITPVIRRGRLLGDAVGIIPVTNTIYTLKWGDEQSEELIRSVVAAQGRREQMLANRISKQAAATPAGR